MIIKSQALAATRCNNCGDENFLDLHAIPIKVDSNPKLWSWVCPNCGTRINQKYECSNAATEIVKSKVRIL